MDIKNFRSMSISIIICIVILISGINAQINLFSQTKTINPNILEGLNEDNITLPKTSDSKLIDKVYNFSNQYTLMINVDLEAEFTYYIYIEIVTPNNCSNFKIGINDPHGHEFQIFENKLSYDPEFGRSFEIPFGTAKKGEHEISFHAETHQNFNLYISMTQGPKCLYDKMKSEDIDHIIHYEVERCYHSKKVEIKNFDLKTDVMYKVHIGRVSAIANNSYREILVDFTIESEELLYIIYNDHLLALIGEIDYFSFGTAIEGEYNFTFEISCTTESLNYNLAYCIVEDEQISEIIDPGDHATNEDSDSNDILENLSDDSIILPQEWVIGALIFIGLLLGGLIVIIRYQNKNKLTRLRLN
jgi:hypothetical protein